MIRPLLCLFLIAFTLKAAAQNRITGKVVDFESSAPVGGASVFISNTSLGTVSNKDGSFELDNIPAGSQDLIISSVGYTTIAYAFTDAKLPMKMEIQLHIKVKELDNVTVEPSVEEGWDKWGRTFTEDFIGVTRNATFCSIKNEKAIKFRYYRKANRLIAYSDEPLLIENKALGYVIKYQLENFEVNFKENTTYFAGYPLFEPIDKKRKGLENKWDHNRVKTYQGSLLHFIRSLSAGQLAKEGFEVRRMTKIPNLEKQRIRALYRAQKAELRTVDKNGAMHTEMSILLNMPMDSLNYYSRISRQEDFIDIYGQSILTADSLVSVDGDGRKTMFFENYLYITYQKALEDQMYIDFFHEARKPTYQRSIITLTDPEAVIIESNGNFYPPQSIISSAYWGWGEKMADCLPLDYEPVDGP